MNDEKQGKAVVKMTRTILGNIVFDSENASVLALMVLHDITAEDLKGKISSILQYLERTKEDEN